MSDSVAILAGVPDPEGSIRVAKVPRLVSTRAAARILGVRVENLDKVAGLPRSLQERDGGHDVSATRLWTRDEIEQLAADRAASGKG